MLRGVVPPEMLSRPGSPRPRPRPRPQKVVLIGLETKTRSRDPHPWVPQVGGVGGGGVRGVEISLYGFDHQTSSPRYAQSNGKAENAVKTAKRLMTKAYESGTDPFIALLDWTNCPFGDLGVSPVQLLMGRRTRSQLPCNSIDASVYAHGSGSQSSVDGG